MRVLTLARGRESSVARRHPWVFSGAVRTTVAETIRAPVAETIRAPVAESFRAPETEPDDGLVEVRTSDGAVAGRGVGGSGGTIVARLWTFGGEPFGADVVRERLAAAAALRRDLIPSDTTGYRLLHSEGDRAPGIVADRYGDVDVLLFTATAAAPWRTTVEGAYREAFAPKTLVVRAEGEAGPAREPSESRFLEHGLHFVADLASGQKTGFFLDQRENRRRIRALSSGRRVLNLFSYSGGFSIAALAGGAARAVDVDASEGALALARRHRAENGFPASDEDFVRADVFQDLRARAATGERWDVVVCDPPAFAKKKADVDRAARGYKDVVRLAMTLMSRGGTLLACSCSGLVSPELFQQILFSAALDAKRTFSILEKCGAGPDHPISIYCPETEYLKAFFLRAED